jgi:hypothetical protein
MNKICKQINDNKVYLYFDSISTPVSEKEFENLVKLTNVLITLFSNFEINITFSPGSLVSRIWFRIRNETLVGSINITVDPNEFIGIQFIDLSLSYQKRLKEMVSEIYSIPVIISKTL